MDVFGRCSESRHRSDTSFGGPKDTSRWRILYRGNTSYLHENSYNFLNEHNGIFIPSEITIKNVDLYFERSTIDKDFEVVFDLEVNQL